MDTSGKQEAGEKMGMLNLVVLVLSVYVLLALLVDTVYQLPAETSALLTYIDNTICVFFFAEFCTRFYQAEQKWRFLKWGWIDLVSSLPAVSFLRAGRLLRLIRLLRLVRAFRSTQSFVRHVFKNKAQGAFTMLSILALLLVIFSSIAILQVEKAPESNIKTAEDAIWWSYVTITTVGYGDKFPVTTEGRLIAAVLMTAGVGLFGTFTAYVASWFVEPARNDNQKS
ncbi:potassium channel family protein [Mucilaginibacter lutimaris]|uniref:Potassium channel family protein n=1 Tax=Mucilaginibacter lutimaris TaxID=931629 RepID=A0ABW2ZGD6_9SPHI